MDKHIEIQLNHLANRIDELSEKIQMLLTIIQEGYADDTEDTEDIIRDLDGNLIGQDRDGTQELWRPTGITYTTEQDGARLDQSNYSFTHYARCARNKDCLQRQQL